MGDVGRERRHPSIRLVALLAATVCALAANVTAAAPTLSQTKPTVSNAGTPLAWESTINVPTTIDVAALTVSTRLTKSAPRAERRSGRANSITLTGPRGLERALLVAARTAAERFGTSNTVIDQATLELVGVERGPQIVQISKYPFSFPLSTLSLGPVAARPLYGEVTASSIRKNEVVLSRTSARLRNAKVGDVLVIRHWDRAESLVRVRVGAIVADPDAGGAEAVLSRITAKELGFSRPSRLAAWGDIASVDAAWTKLVPESYLRRSNSPPTIDSVLSQAELKTTYGEFTVRRDRGRLESEPTWVRANVVSHTYPIIGTVSCHRAMVEPLERVMNELVAAGLQNLIDVRDTKRAGGCFSAREIRTPNGTSGRNLSRHAWAAAIDINPSTNRFGAKPTMDARVIYVFRRNGFAWGGTWSIPDGMHFELVGAARITGSPLPSSTTTTSTTTTSTTSTTTTSTTTTSTTVVGATIAGATTSALADGATSTVPVTAGRATTTGVGTTSTRSRATTTTTRALPPTTTIAATTSVLGAASTTTTTTLQPLVAPELPPQEPSAGDVPA